MYSLLSRIVTITGWGVHLHETLQRAGKKKSGSSFERDLQGSMSVVGRIVTLFFPSIRCCHQHSASAWPLAGNEGNDCNT